MGRRVRRFALIIFLILAAFPFAVVHAQEMNGLLEELKLFSKAIGVITDAYPGDVQPRNLLYQAVKGMMGSLDKFSEFIDPERYALLQIMMKGEFVGIGALLQMINEQVVIRAVEPGKPAEQAGLRAGDIILKVNGASVEKKKIADVSALLRGAENTTVVINIFRSITGQIFDVTIQRQKIEIKATRDEHKLGKKLGYFLLSAWQDNTAAQADKTLEDLKKEGMKALIIDLRNNDGGLLTQAVALAERFLPKGTKIVSVRSKIPEQRKEYFVSAKGKYLDLPLVILVNEKTASASEVFSGAMQDHRRATLVGVQTFGKGSVQSVIPLDDKSAMKLTTAKYATPSGRIIDMIGLTPDRVIANGPEGSPGSDKQMQEAMSVLKEYI